MVDPRLDAELAPALDTLVADGRLLPMSRGSVEEARRNYRDLALIRRGEGQEPVGHVEDRVASGPDAEVPVRAYTPTDDRGVTVVWLHRGLVHGYFGLAAASIAARQEGDRALEALVALLED